MHAKPEKVRARRIKRQIKAALSIGVAVCAGVFLACQKSPLASSEAGAPNAGPTQGEPNVDATSPSEINVDLDDGTSKRTADATPGNGPSPSDAGHKPDALARVLPTPTRDAAVDRNEHRKGMPVPDNLLE